MKTSTAIGAALRNGDYLRLENQWARVCITWVRDYPEDKPVYMVDGDTTNGRRVDIPTAREALDYALACLAQYAEGAHR